MLAYIVFLLESIVFSGPLELSRNSQNGLLNAFSRRGRVEIDPMTDNRFDFLRLVFASTVFAYHLMFLALSPGERLENGFAELSLLAVQGFFVVSGALVYGSLQRSGNLGSYTEKRIRRLYPAYAVIVLVPALYALFKTGAIADVGRYLGANLIFLNFLEPNLPGLFEGQVETTVNGSLWTLKIEVMFYIALPLISWVLTKSGRAMVLVLAAVYIGAEVWHHWFQWLANQQMEEGRQAGGIYLQLSRQLPGQMSYFISGIALWIIRDRLKDKWLAAGLAGIVLLLVSYFSGYLQPIRAAGLALLIASIAYAPGPKLNVGKYGDVSYGVYITHFPIVQALVAAGLFQINATIGVTVSIGLVVVSSFILWRMVERPMLRRDSHYRRAEA